MTRSSIPRRGDQGAMLVATMLALALIAVVGPITGIASLPTGSLPNWLIGPFQAAAPKPANWSQFRNTPTLTGVAASPLPPTLRLQWTYEAGSAIESSAAVVDGVAYVGTSGGALVAICLLYTSPSPRD